MKKSTDANSDAEDLKALPRRTSRYWLPTKCENF